MTMTALEPDMHQVAAMTGAMAWRFRDLKTDASYLKGGHLVISSFDGIHLGHRALLKRAAEKVDGEGEPVVALLFDDASEEAAVPPVLDKTERIRLLREAGVEVVALGFSQYASWLDIQALCELVREFEPKSITMSANFRFGFGGFCKADQIASRAQQDGLRVDTLAPVDVGSGRRVASGKTISACLASGDIETATALLGRYWSVTGPVVHGHKRGRELGFPTANVPFAREVNLAHGIYAVRVHLDGQVLNGVASYGTRPQFDNGAPLLEVHILDFSRVIYESSVRVEFVAYQRPEMVFDGIDALIRQMDVDCATARDLLATVSDGIAA